MRQAGQRRRKMNAMQHITQSVPDDLRGIRADLCHAYHAPGRLYSSPEIAALEKERIFLKNWLLICRADEIAQPGDYLTMRIVDEPILVARDLDGRVAVSMNQCAHRGVEVAKGSGNAKRLSCPYHAWTYEVGGRLLTAPLSASSGRDLSKCRLRSLRVAEWRGWVFASFDADAPPFESFIAAWEPHLWFYQAAQCRTAFKVTIDMKCNWKLLTENVSDLYHARAVHGASFGSQFNLSNGELPVELVPQGGWVMNFDSTQRQNFAHKFPTLPWLVERPEFAAGKSAVFPNVNLFANRESMRTSVFWPLALDLTRVTWYFLLPQSSLDAPAAAEGLEYYEAQIKTIAGEDQAVVESLQRACASTQYRPGPLLPMEAPVRHMINYYLDVVGTWMWSV
jgi:Rieske 2Fe-2S family protein